MTSAIVAILAAGLLNGCGQRAATVVAGGDPARGLLVNASRGARPFDAPDPSIPTVVFVHGFNPAPRLVHFAMADRLGEAVAHRGGPARNVLAWDWNAATFDNLRPSLNAENAVRQGWALAEALARSGVDPSHIHLIGHSAGGMVATSAAWMLARQYGRPVARLTLLDPATFYHEVIFTRLDAGSLAPLVENYWTPGPSAFGREVRLPGVRDVRIEPRAPITGVVCPLRSDHLSLVDWYIATARHASIPGGFNVDPAAPARW